MLPPQEILSTHMRQISSLDGRLHTFPAWLGYGTLILSDRARTFLETFLSLEKDPRAIAMADNYYSILSNHYPELWFGQEFDLGLGQPFTAGSAGEERNWRYMEFARALLQRALSLAPEKASFVDRRIGSLPRSVWRAPCRRQLCLVESDVELIPSLHSPPANLSLRETDWFRRERLEQGVKDLFVGSPLSSAVDGDELTEFCALDSDTSKYIMLDLFREVSRPINVIVGANSSAIIDGAVKEFSADGHGWTRAPCGRQGTRIICSSEQPWRFFRITIELALKENLPWCIKELYI